MDTFRMPLWRSWHTDLPQWYKNDKDQEIIGVKDAALFWITDHGTGTDTVAGGGMTKTTFDTTSYSDGAILKINNNHGADVKVKAVCIYGKPVVRYSGEKGVIHDDFVDYDSIVRDGEKKLEFGNNYIVTKAQLESLCDHYWKANNYKRHIYELEIPGRCYWFSPGEWYTVQIGTAGDVEYIDSVCECYDIQVESEAGGMGRTVVALREVYQNWTKDSGALARFLGSGSPKDKYNFSRVLVASQYYPGPSDFRCDGTADQTEIQAAIDQVAGFGGGVVELTEGTFNTTAAIDLSYDNVVLTGAGAKTVISKNCDDYALKIVGTSGTYINNSQVLKLKVTRNSADTNSGTDNSLIYLQYANGCVVDGCHVTSAYFSGYGIYCENCTSVAVRNNLIEYCFWAGIMLSSASSSNVVGNVVRNNYGIGISVSASDNTIVGENQIYDNYYSGVSMASDDCTIAGNVISDNAQQTYANIQYRGIYVDGDSDRLRVSDNTCVDNGNLLYYTQGISAYTTTPYIMNDARSLSGTSVTRSSAQYYGDGPSVSTVYQYSFKVKITTSSTGEYRFCDNVTKNDLHGLYPGTQYKLSAYTYLLTTGSPTTAEVKLILGYTTDAAGAWHETTGNVTTDHDAWGLAETTNWALPSYAVGAKALIRINAAASTDEYIYIDNVRLQPVGTHNLHSQNFYDAGSNTYIGV